MKRKILLIMVLATLSLSACSKKDDDAENLTSNENTTETNNSSMEVMGKIPMGEDEKIDYEYVNLEGVIYNLAPADFDVLPEGGFIILAPKGDCIIKYDTSNNITNIDAAGHEFEDMFFTVDNEIVLKEGVNKYYKLQEDGTFVEIKKSDITIKSKCVSSVWTIEEASDLVKRENARIAVVRCDNKGNIYTYEERYDESKDYICKYDKQGNVIEYTTFTKDDCVTFMQCPITVDEDGNIFLLQCYKNEILIKKVTLDKVK